MLLLVRHGEATANLAGVLLGRDDVPLTERGRAQAEALRPRLAGAHAVISSPLRRAVDTAQAVCPDLPLAVDDRWIELDYGEYEGAAPGDVADELWQRWRADPGYCPAGGESLLDVSTRVRGACEELFASEGPARRTDVVVVSHVSPIKAAVAWALGVEDLIAWRMRLSTGSVTRLGWGPGVPLLHEFNLVP